MILIVSESPVRARTIWAALGSPEDKISCSFDPENIGLNPKTAWDEDHGFAPIWGVLDERAFRAFCRQARKAQEIVLAQRDEWAASVLEETLRSNGITVPIRRVVIDDLRPEAIARDLARTVQINRELVARSWRRKTADRITGGSLLKALKKPLELAWQPTMREVQMLRWISQAGLNDQDCLQYDVPPHPFDPHAPSVMGALLRGSESQPPEDVARQIQDLLDAGLLSHKSPEAIGALVLWCAENLKSDPSVNLNAMDMLVPMDAAYDLREILPAQRQVYTDVWQHSVRLLVPGHKVKPAQPVGKWLGELAQLICRDPMEYVATIGKLREDGLVRGWSYLALTDRGHLVDATIQAAFPKLADWATIAAAIARVDDPLVSRESALTTVQVLATPQKAPEVPGVTTLCPACRNPLVLRLNHRTLRAVCQASECGKSWPVEQHWKTFHPLLPHEAPRWCQKCSRITVHTFSLESSTQSTRQTCKECNAGQTN